MSHRGFAHSGKIPSVQIHVRLGNMNLENVNVLRKYYLCRLCDMTGDRAALGIGARLAAQSAVFGGRFREGGGQIVSRKVDSFGELEGYDIIVNCTGLGSRQLCGDRRLVALRGQVFKVSVIVNSVHTAGFSDCMWENRFQ